MAGGYTHITAVQKAVEEAINRRPGLLHDEAKLALERWLKYVIVGSIGPDYPYLDIGDKNSAAWADTMHKKGCADVLREGVRLIRLIDNELIRQKCMAWLFGFAAHCVTDGSVHPVVNLKVGKYEEHKTEHRVCEMSQDVFAHAQLNAGPLDTNRQLSLNVQDASDGSSKKLDRDIARMWTAALNSVYRKGHPVEESSFGWAVDRLMEFAGQKKAAEGLSVPDPDDWHRGMLQVMKIAESGGCLIPFVRHVAANQGIVYPQHPDPQYIKGLKVPGGKHMDFDAIFQKAVSNIAAFWGTLSLSLTGKPSALDAMLNWNLDTGLDEEGHSVFWS